MKKAVRLVERSQGTADGGVGVEQPQKLLHNNVNDKARSARPTVPVARSKPASDSVRFSPSARAQETRRCANVQLTAHEAVDHNRVTDSTFRQSHGLDNRRTMPHGLDIHCRRSSEMRFTDAAFSVAKIVLPRDLAM